MGGEGAGLREEEVLGEAEELLVVRVSEDSRKKVVYIKDLSTSGLHQRPVNKWFTSKTCQQVVYIKDLSTSGLHQRPVNKWFTSKTCQQVVYINNLSTQSCEKIYSFLAPLLSQGPDISFILKIDSFPLLFFPIQRPNLIHYSPFVGCMKSV